MTCNHTPQGATAHNPAELYGNVANILELTAQASALLGVLRAAIHNTDPHDARLAMAGVQRLIDDAGDLASEVSDGLASSFVGIDSEGGSHD